jgi:hypothetical protein
MPSLFTIAGGASMPSQSIGSNPKKASFAVEVAVGTMERDKHHMFAKCSTNLCQMCPKTFLKRQPRNTRLNCVRDGPSASGIMRGLIAETTDAVRSSQLTLPQLAAAVAGGTRGLSQFSLTH